MTKAIDKVKDKTLNEYSVKLTCRTIRDKLPLCFDREIFDAINETEELLCKYASGKLCNDKK